MKKTILFFLLFCVMATADTLGVRVEKNRQLNIDQITTANFNQFYKKVNKLFSANDLYVAVKRKESRAAYVYGCDATGREKLTINCVRKDGQWLEVSLNVLIEGDVSNDQAEASANALLETMTKALTIQEGK